MEDSLNKESQIENPQLAAEHPAHLKLTEKLKELEADGVAAAEDEYITEVEKFVRAEPELAVVLAEDNQYLQSVMKRMGVEREVMAEGVEEVSSIEKAHSRAFATAQAMNQDCQSLARELKVRMDEQLTPLIEENALRFLYNSVQPFEDALASRQTQNAIDSLPSIHRVLSSIEPLPRQQIAENLESLKKLGFYLQQMEERCGEVARIYGEVDTEEALEISSGNLQIRDVLKTKLDLIHRLFSATSNY